MKALLLVLTLALAAGAGYYFYFRNHPISWFQGPELAGAKTSGEMGSTPAPKKDFKDLSLRLQKAMDHIPARLRDAREIPTAALDTRSQLAPYVGLHAEYATITQVCDAIIDADQRFADHQEKCGFAPPPTGTSPQERARLASQGPAAFQQQQTLWDNQRLQADSKVRQLLATLENRRL